MGRTLYKVRDKLFNETDKPSLFFILAETGEPQWDNEEEVTSELTLLGLVGIDTVDEYVSRGFLQIGLRVVCSKMS